MTGDANNGMDQNVSFFIILKLFLVLNQYNQQACRDFYSNIQLLVVENYYYKYTTH